MRYTLPMYITLTRSCSLFENTLSCTWWLLINIAHNILEVVVSLKLVRIKLLTYMSA